MIVLGFDTSAAHCAAALLRDGTLLSTRREAMARGQSERLMGLLQELLSEHDLTWSDLSGIGVGIGPGNFTGIRIGVAAARGLALGLGIPAIGVSQFDVIGHGQTSPALACVPAPQDQLYVAPCGGADDEPPRLTSRDLAEGQALPLIHAPDLNPAPVIAAIAAARLHLPQPRPAPLYIKAADAAPPRDAPPRIVA